MDCSRTTSVSRARPLAAAPLSSAAHDERRATREVRALRLQLWTELLAHDALRSRIVELVMHALREAGARSETLTALLGPALQLDELARLVDLADPDRIVVERVLAVLDEECVDRAWLQQLRAIHRRGLDARNRFASSHLRLVYKLANDCGRAHMPFEDRVQEGNLGLLKAIERFDPERGFRFTTYAAWWIRAGIVRSLVNYGRTVRIPAHLHVLFMKARRMREQLMQRSGREPSVQEVADALGTDAEHVTIAEDAMGLRTLALDVAPRDGDSDADQLVVDVAHEDEVWLASADEQRHLALVETAWMHLDEQERDVLARRFGLAGRAKETLREIGESFGRSHERVRQIQVRALGKLREHVETSPVSTLAILRDAA